MNTQYIDCQIIMSPQNKVGFSIGDLCLCTKSIHTDEKVGDLEIAIREYKGESVWQPQHIYLTSDEEIKKGDWYILRTIINGEYKLSNNWATCRHNVDKKIESCTDLSLGLPSIPKEWIKDVYVSSNGKIDMVRLEIICGLGCGGVGTSCMDRNGCKTLKLTKKNEVCIIDEPNIVKIEGGSIKSNNDGTFSITPLVTVLSNDIRSNDNDKKDYLKNNKQLTYSLSNVDLDDFEKVLINHMEDKGYITWKEYKERYPALQINLGMFLNIFEEGYNTAIQSQQKVDWVELKNRWDKSKPISKSISEIDSDKIFEWFKAKLQYNVFNMDNRENDNKFTKDKEKINMEEMSEKEKRNHIVRQTFDAVGKIGFDSGWRECCKFYKQLQIDKSNNNNL